jgi:hypothetical protein
VQCLPNGRAAYSEFFTQTQIGKLLMGRKVAGKDSIPEHAIDIRAKVAADDGLEWTV